MLQKTSKIYEGFVFQILITDQEGLIWASIMTMIITFPVTYVNKLFKIYRTKISSYLLCQEKEHLVAV